METEGRLRRRVEALEQATGVLQGLPCVECGRLHVDEALSLDRLSARYMGSTEPVPPICGCACCAPIMADLVSRYEAATSRTS